MSGKTSETIDLFIKLPERKRRGCDLCGYDHPTEKFVGYNGTVLWIGQYCLDWLKSKENYRKHLKGSELKWIKKAHENFYKTNEPVASQQGEK